MKLTIFKKAIILSASLFGISQLKLLSSDLQMTIDDAVKPQPENDIDLRHGCAGACLNCHCSRPEVQEYYPENEPKSDDELLTIYLNEV